MTRPDQRLAYREGGFNASAAFYPRRGCPPPPPGFSLLSAGGFDPSEVVAEGLLGMFPEQDPSSCQEQALDQTVVRIPLQALEDPRELACTGRGSIGATRYWPPPGEEPDLAELTWACAGLPDLSVLFGGAGGGDPEPALPQQLVVADHPGSECPGLTHYALLGCEGDAGCADPEWDRTSTPPAWWPCPSTPSPGP